MNPSPAQPLSPLPGAIPIVLRPSRGEPEHSLNLSYKTFFSPSSHCRKLQQLARREIAVGSETSLFLFVKGRSVNGSWTFADLENLWRNNGKPIEVFYSRVSAHGADF